MGEQLTLTAADGHVLSGYAARPDGQAKGGIVLLQEIFGVTGHIRAVVDSYAAEGYAAVAPGLFDRVRPGVELAYTDIASGKALVEQTNPADTLKDVAAAVAWARGFGKVAVVGFCWGGTLAYLAAGALPVESAVAYYGGMIAKFLDRKPKAPVLYHFGAKDAFIPAADVDAIRAAAGGDEVHVYDAGHGFNCDERADYHAPSASLARQRTLDFLARTLA